MNEYADLLIMNAAVYTVDQANPRAEAVAVKGNTIVFVGSTAEAEAWRGPETQVIEGHGRTLLPGFIDSHFHLLHGAETLADMQLHKVASLADLRAAVTTYAATHPDLPVLCGVGLRYGLPTPDEPLTRHHLDALERERPLILIAYDVHTVWANTAALERAGLLHGLPGVAGVIMGADGLATGELREPPACDPVLNLIPEVDDQRRRELMRQGLAYLASLGVTSVHNMNGDANEAAFYAALEDLSELTLRVYVPYSVTPETPLTALAEEAVAMRSQFNSELVRAGCVKFFMDGVFESYTAVSLQAYPDQPHNFGEPIFGTDHFARMATEADRLGLQIFVHACGDGAVRRVLDGYEVAQRVNGRRDSRHRVEHIELIHPDDVPRFAQLGVVASMQPIHSPLSPEDTDVWRQRVRPQRWQDAFAWRTLREAGATLAFGSDWPVASPDPLLGMAAALTRQPWQPGQPSHQQTLAEAIASYTRDAAYAEFQEDKKGQIKVGYWADLVLLTADIFATPPEEIADVRVGLTVCNGRIVYES
jgi:hypothetical protein